MTSNRFNNLRTRPAFTLVEMIATIAIIAVIGSVSSSLIITATDGYTAASASAQLCAEASIGMDRVVREFRSIAVDSSGSDNVPDIDTIAPASITWETDSSLTLSGTDLQLRIDGGATRTLLGDVTAFSVRAYDESNTALALNLSDAECDAVRRLEVTITLGRSGVTHTIRTRIFLRGMMIGA